MLTGGLGSSVTLACQLHSPLLLLVFTGSADVGLLLLMDLGFVMSLQVTVNGCAQMSCWHRLQSAPANSGHVPCASSAWPQQAQHHHVAWRHWIGGIIICSSEAYRLLS